MSITASDLYESARSKIGLNFQDGRLDDNNFVGVMSCINSGTMEFSLDHDWDFLYTEGTFATVAGTDSYAFPTNHIRTLWLAIEDREMSQMQRRDAVRYWDAPAEPYFFSALGNGLKLSPVPDGIYTVRHGYYKHLPKITATTSSELTTIDLDILAPYEGLVALFIAKHICLMFKDYNAYKAVENEIRIQKRAMDDNVMRSLAPRSPQTRQDA